MGPCIRRLTMVGVLAIWLAPAATGSPPFTPEPLVQRLIQENYDPGYVRALFGRPEVKIDPGVMVRKLTHRESRLNYARFLKPSYVTRAESYLREKETVLSRTEKRYGMPANIAVAILTVETDLGRYLGKARVLNTLASMAALDDFETLRPFLPPDLQDPSGRRKIDRFLKRKSCWAYEELKALLLYAQGNGHDALGIRGSIFGAFGLCQFIPSNALRYGIDADGDMAVDLFQESDALASMANYLRAHGWRPDIGREKKRAVIYRYNHSKPYVDAVISLADRLRPTVTSPRKPAPPPRTHE